MRRDVLPQSLVVFPSPSFTAFNATENSAASVFDDNVDLFFRSEGEPSPGLDLLAKARIIYTASQLRAKERGESYRVPFEKVLREQLRRDLRREQLERGGESGKVDAT